MSEFEAMAGGPDGGEEDRAAGVGREGVERNRVADGVEEMGEQFGRGTGPTGLFAESPGGGEGE